VRAQQTLLDRSADLGDDLLSRTAGDEIDVL